MSDENEWLKERRTIHNAATEGPWVYTVYGVEAPEPPNPEDRFDILTEVIARTELKDEDTASIVDAHNNLPALLTAVENVLKRHKPVHQVFSWQAGGTTAYDPCETCHGKAGVHECGCWADKDLVYTCAECRDDKGRDIDYPCQTVRSIEGAIK